MNPRLTQLQPYPFQRLRELFAGIAPNPDLKAVNLSIGEPKHATPQFIKDALTDNLQGLASYPVTQGSDDLRGAIADWCGRRYGVQLDAGTQVLPVIGSREALFAFAQAVIDPTRHVKRVLAPNPFYQIYEGAALLAGAKPYFLNTLPDKGYRCDYGQIPEDLWETVQLAYVCSPGNPTGHVMNLDEWRVVFELSDRYGFVIASDECYSEIYFNEGEAPLGALTAAKELGRDLRNLVVFNSLSKRSNVPGLRSGFVAGDAEVIKQFLLYRTYHGSAMNPAVQAASAAAWREESHVIENRRQYREKFAAVMPILQDSLTFTPPDAAFYLWARVPGGEQQPPCSHALPTPRGGAIVTSEQPIGDEQQPPCSHALASPRGGAIVTSGRPIGDDAAFARDLYREKNVTVLPGSFLARDAKGVNPGRGFIRIALVDGLEPCVEAARRIVDFVRERR